MVFCHRGVCWKILTCFCCVFLHEGIHTLLCFALSAVVNSVFPPWFQPLFLSKVAHGKFVTCSKTTTRSCHMRITGPHYIFANTISAILSYKSYTPHLLTVTFNFRGTHIHPSLKGTKTRRVHWVTLLLTFVAQFQVLLFKLSTIDAFLENDRYIL